MKPFMIILFAFVFAQGSAIAQVVGPAPPALTSQGNDRVTGVIKSALHRYIKIHSKDDAVDEDVVQDVDRLSRDISDSLSKEDRQFLLALHKRGQERKKLISQTRRVAVKPDVILGLAVQNIISPENEADEFCYVLPFVEERILEITLLSLRSGIADEPSDPTEPSERETVPTVIEPRDDELVMGRTNLKEKYVLSWSIDHERELLLVRLSNRDEIEKTASIEIGSVEATVVFRIDGLKREFFDKAYYNKLLTSTWIARSRKIPAGHSVNWFVPFDRLEEHPVVGGEPMSFRQCLSTTKPVVESIRLYSTMPDATIRKITK